MADEKMKRNKSTSICFIILWALLGALPLIWVFIFSLGNITVTAASRKEFSDAIEKKIKIASLAEELMILIPESAQQLKLEVNRSRIRCISITFISKPDTIQPYLDQLKKKLPNYTFELTETPQYRTLFLRCTNPDLWLPLPEITLHFSQININEQGGKIEIETF